MKSKLSPHVLIYSFPITAISSILNRAMGLGCTAMYVGGGTSILFDIQLKKYYDSLNRVSKMTLHYCTLFPPVYHTYGGLRHLFWDANPKWLTNTRVVKSSYILLGTSIFTTIIIEKQLYNLTL